MGICEALARPSEIYPWCMCNARSVAGEIYCAHHLKEHRERMAKLKERM